MYAVLIKNIFSLLKHENVKVKYDWILYAFRVDVCLPFCRIIVICELFRE